MKTITEIERNIYSLNGFKIEYTYLIENGVKYFNSKNFNKNCAKFTPCELLFCLTECEVPEECFYAYYYIPTKKPENYKQLACYKYDNCMAPTEVLFFVGSSDGVNADYVEPIFPTYLSAAEQGELFFKIVN